jgi:hypothetical protein
MHCKVVEGTSMNFRNIAAGVRPQQRRAAALLIVLSLCCGTFTRPVGQVTTASLAGTSIQTVNYAAFPEVKMQTANMTADTAHGPVIIFIGSERRLVAR